jgi:hypothetical protein
MNASSPQLPISPLHALFLNPYPTSSHPNAYSCSALLLPKTIAAAIEIVKLEGLEDDSKGCSSFY